MKRFIALCLAFVMLLGLAGCAGTDGEEAKNPDVADVMAKLTSELTFPEMSEKTVDDLPYFGYDTLDVSKVEDMAFIIASSGLTAEEVLIVKMTEEAAAKELKALMEEHRDQVAATAEGYTPEEMGKINSAVIEAKGQYAYFAITTDNEKAKTIFDESF